MLLTEETDVPAEALPVQSMKDHLRIGTGFSDDGMQDGLIIGHLRAAIATIEARTGKALLARRFKLRLDRWRDGRGGQALPVAPVAALVSVAIEAADGTVRTIDPASYRLVQDMARPRVVGAQMGFPALTEGRVVEIVFDAGFGTAWANVPADLAQAVLLLAAEHYETRHDAGMTRAALPMAVHALIERWRTVRILGGGAA
jgi:uncharacterized phiE125 gp8 family phage protein